MYSFEIFTRVLQKAPNEHILITCYCDRKTNVSLISGVDRCFKIVGVIDNEIMGSTVYECTAYPFIITHDCPAEYCKKEIRSLIVLRSPRRVKSIEFDPRILSYRSPLDFGWTNDSSLKHHTLKIAEEYNILFKKNKYGNSDCSTCPHCDWGMFGNVVFNQLKTLWDTDSVEKLEKFDFETSVDLMNQPFIRKHFIMEGDDESKEIVGSLRKSLFDSKAEANLYEQILGNLNSRGFSIGTHVSPKDIFDHFNVNRAQDLSKQNSREAVYNSIDHSIIHDITAVTNYWFNTTYDFVICNSENGYHRPMIILEYDGYGGCLDENGNYCLPPWTWHKNPSQRERSVNQKIKWAQQFSIPLLVITSDMLDENIVEQSIETDETIRKLSIAMIWILQLLEEQSKITLDRHGDGPIQGFEQSKRTSGSIPFYRVLSAMHDINDKKSEYGVSFDPPFDVSVSWTTIESDDAMETLVKSSPQTYIPSEFVSFFREGNSIQSRVGQGTFTGPDNEIYSDFFYLPIIYSSEGEVKHELLANTSFLSSMRGSKIWRKICELVHTYENQ